MKSFICVGFLVAVVTADISVTNNCKKTIWVGVTAGPNSELPENGGFELDVSATKNLDVGRQWSGKIWGRTNCDEKGDCETGDCGRGIQCGGKGPSTPVTLADVTLGVGNFDFYDISLVDGYNVPMAIAPKNGTEGAEDCESGGCVSDLNEICPPELSVVNNDAEVVGCSSFCSGENPDECEDSEFLDIFRKACPVAYAHPFDDAGNLLTCDSSLKVDYVVTFCP